MIYISKVLSKLYTTINPLQIKKMDKMLSAFSFLSLFLIVLLIISSNGIFSNADDYDEHQRKEFSLGGSVDDYSRVGKEEKAAMNMAKEHLFARDIGHRPILPVQSSHGDSTQAASSGES